MFDSKENIDMLVKNAKERLENQNIANDKLDTEENYYADFYNDTDYNNDFKNNDESTYDDSYEDNYEDYDIDHNGEKLWHNGPTKSMIQLWKKQFEGHDVLYVEFDDNKFIIRTLNRHEYKSIVSIPNSNALNREEIICETVVLWPESFTWKEMAVKKAGIPSALAEIIMKKSGFHSEYDVEVL